MHDTLEYLEDFRRELECVGNDGNRVRCNMNVNMDMDGCFCAALMLLAYPDFRICGYNDSCTQYYTMRKLLRKSIVNLDFFCKSRGVLCIDNHINSVTPASFPLKYNPNFMRGVALDRYTDKYPFSTFIFLCAVFDHFGMLPDIDIDTDIEGVGAYKGSTIKLWQLMLRADSVLYNTMHYYMNANEWWKWLVGISGKDGITYKLYRKIMLFRKICEENNFDCKAESVTDKNYISSFFMTKYGTRKKDGFDRLGDGFFKFLTDVFGMMGVNAQLPSPDELVLCTYRRVLYESDNISFFEKLINDDRVLSYAFVYKNMISLNIREEVYKSFEDDKTISRCFHATDPPVSSTDFNIPIIL